ncbi:MAG: hypothetical protein R2712_18815 [Vicinamibacterales bacterium]
MIEARGEVAYKGRHQRDQDGRRQVARGQPHGEPGACGEHGAPHDEAQVHGQRRIGNGQRQEVEGVEDEGLALAGQRFADGVVPVPQGELAVRERLALHHGVGQDGPHHRADVRPAGELGAAVVAAEHVRRLVVQDVGRADGGRHEASADQERIGRRPRGTDAG